MRLRVIPFLLLAFASCTSGRKQLERAATYEQAGMLTQAFDAYDHLYQHHCRIP